MKRKIALVLVCLLLLAAFTACSGTPVPARGLGKGVRGENVWCASKGDVRLYQKVSGGDRDEEFSSRKGPHTSCGGYS